MFSFVEWDHNLFEDEFMFMRRILRKSFVIIIFGRFQFDRFISARIFRWLLQSRETLHIKYLLRIINPCLKHDTFCDYRFLKRCPYDIIYVQIKGKFSELKTVPEFMGIYELLIIFNEVQ